MDQIGNNPFIPGMRSSLFVPDQLVSGPLQLVTATVTLAVAGILKRGTVLGKVSTTGNYVVCVKTATDGSEAPVAILVDDVNTTAAVLTSGVYLMGEFNQNRLIFDASWKVDELRNAFRPIAIFLRDSIQAPVA